MATATAIPTRRLISVDGLCALFEALVADGYHVIGPSGVLGRVPSEPTPAAAVRRAIERRLGIDIRNTDRVIPELQDLKVGDEIPMPGYAMRVERLDPGQVLVIRSSNHAWVWSFELRPVNGHTRLISWNRFDTAALPMRDKLAYPIIEPGSWVMERKMLLTIKQRAEQLAPKQTAG